MPQVKEKQGVKADEVVDVRPKFRTPREGGSYLLSPNDLGKKDAAPVFVEGTDREPTSAEARAAKKIRGDDAAAKESSAEG